MKNNNTIINKHHSFNKGNKQLKKINNIINYDIFRGKLHKDKSLSQLEHPPHQDEDPLIQSLFNKIKKLKD